MIGVAIFYNLEWLTMQLVRMGGGGGWGWIEIVVSPYALFSVMSFKFTTLVYTSMFSFIGSGQVCLKLLKLGQIIGVNLSEIETALV